MAAPPHKRSKSEPPPPPIMVQDTATGAEPQPSPSPTAQHGQAFRNFDPVPDPQSQDSPTNTRSRRQGTWEKGHRRKHSPNIEWHEKWTKDSWKEGRVLLIDYVARELCGQGRRKIVAQEFSDIDGLRKFYRNNTLSKQAALRVIHVQNASWAARFLLRKFNIDATNDLVGTNFGRWARYEKPQRRGGKPVLNGKTFRSQRDPWRGISRTAFGLDYLRHYDKNKISDANNNGMKMMELNQYDLMDQPTYGLDVFVQRLSVYVQMNDGEPGAPVDLDIQNPYDEAEYQEYQRLKKQYGSIDANGHEHYIPKLQTLDNGSTIIIFENSHSRSVQDTLIGARQELEQRWRRLTFYLPREETDNDETLATDCMDLILCDIFKALAFNWEKYIAICETHVGILEDKIYENPADESRAPELWVNSSLWLKVERLMYLHSDIVKEMQNYLRDAHGADPSEDQPWLGNTAAELDKLITLFQEGALKPTAGLSDLMYKSVGIRDARHSLQLGLSMWRLSWITFIFLPLTFVCGFFGMNVDTFEGNPSIKWWFVATVPLFVLVITGWYGVKHTLASQRQNPLRRGVYESLYIDLAKQYPDKWTRRGPRTDIIPRGRWSALKWSLINRWFGAERTILAKGYDPGDEELGSLSRLRRYLVRRWLPDIDAITPADTAALTDSELPLAMKSESHLSTVVEALSIATPIALAEADPTAASRLGKRTLGRWRSVSPRPSEERAESRGGSSDGRPSSGVMVEEKGVSEDERSGDESGEGGVRGRNGGRDGVKEGGKKEFRASLNVPRSP